MTNIYINRSNTSSYEKNKIIFIAAFSLTHLRDDVFLLQVKDRRK